MSFLLALDIGTRRTGVAFGDTSSGFVVALNTIHHASNEELATQIEPIVRERNVSELIIGLPRLPSGSEGTQAKSVRLAANVIETRLHLPVQFVDERYTSAGQKGLKNDHAKAACEILFSVLGSQEKDH